MILLLKTFQIVGLKIYRSVVYKNQYWFENQSNYLVQIDWLEENVSSKWHWWRLYNDQYDLMNGYMVGFTNDVDAMAFKLRWT